MAMSPRSQSILIGGLVTAVLSTSVLGLINLICCLGVIIGAVVAVWHYTSSQRLTITAGQGASIGALSAIVGALISTVLNLALTSLGLDFSGVFNEAMLDLFRDMMPPEQIAEMERQMREGQSAGQLIVSSVIAIFVFAIFGAAGGAIGAALFKKGGAERV